MLGFFEEMARDAAGWSEPKGWFSEFVEVQIIATHRGSDVELRVLMRWEERPGQPHRTQRDADPWYEQERRGVLMVQPEDLGPFAAQMRRLMRREHGHRWELDWRDELAWLERDWRASRGGGGGGAG
jgi:hypothetical protein